MAGAGVGAAADAHVVEQRPRHGELLRRVEWTVPGVEILPGQASHFRRVGGAALADGAANAGAEIADEASRHVVAAQAVQRRIKPGQLRLRHGDAEVKRGQDLEAGGVERLHRRRERIELVRREVAERHEDAHGHEPVRERRDGQLAPGREAVAGGRSQGEGGLGRWIASGHVGARSVGGDLGVVFVEEPDQSLIAEVVAEKADARMATVRAAALVVEERRERHRRADALRSGERVEELQPQPRLEADSAGEIRLEDRLALRRPLRDEAEVVALGEPGVGGAVGEGDLELARQAVGEVEAVERVREGARIRRDVEDRIGEQPGVGADQRVAEGVAAAAAEAEAGRFASFERGRDLGGRDAVELEVLSGGEMDEIAAVAAEYRRRRAEVAG